MKAEIITIGDEILIGQIVNTNADTHLERQSLAEDSFHQNQ
jgi:molybdopterin-biosynthesis enzyme MoeA-like protein